jgi:hypothetical protein
MLFVFIFIYALFVKEKYTRRELTLYKYFLFLIASSFLAGYFSTGFQFAFSLVRDFVIIVVFLYSLSIINQNYLTSILKLSTIISTFFLILSLSPIWVTLGIMNNYYPPIEAIRTNFNDLNFDDFQFTLESGTSANSGFSGTRTSAGLCISSLTLYIISNILYIYRLKYFIKLFCAIVILILSSLCLVLIGARSGFFILILSIPFFFNNRKKIFSIYLFFALIFYLFIYLNLYLLLPDFFIRGFNPSANLVDNIDSTTTGRFSSYILGLQNFWNSPIWGVGPEKSFVYVNDGELVHPHNTFIRIMSESGLLLFIPVLYIFSYMYKKFKSKYLMVSIYSYRIPNYFPVVSCYFIYLFIEPRILFGSFNLNLIFWYCFGIFINEINSESVSQVKE